VRNRLRASHLKFFAYPKAEANLLYIFLPIWRFAIFGDINMFTSPRLRRPLLSASVLCAAASLLGGCKFDPLAKRDHTMLVLVDQSGSIRDVDRAIYEQSFRAIGASLVAGDRLVLAPVNASSRSQFVTALDVTIPTTGRKSQDALNLASCYEKIEELVPILLPANTQGSVKVTRLLETIVAASEAFGPTPIEGSRLVLMTDGVEDSSLADFDDLPDDPTAVTTVLDKARDLGMLPNLSGVKISIVGAGGDDFAAIQNFWKAYATATGATLTQYGRLPFKADS
jgi:hypothetical protein